MKKIIKILAFCIIFSTVVAIFGITSFAQDNSFNISAKSVCLIEAESGRVLYGKNENLRISMASTTKIMTAIIALESDIPLSREIFITKEAVAIEGSSIYLSEGEKITFEALMYGLLLCSANDAATAIAIAVSGSVENFVSEMNFKAQVLGLTDTHFVNPHGLHDDDHYTTAYDLARLMSYCMQNENFIKISGCAKKVFPKGADESRVMINHNKLLKQNIGVVSGKTGFTKKSGRCLVSCAQKENLNLICVTLNAPDDWNDHKTLYEFGFKNYKRMNLAAISLDIPVISGQKSKVLVNSTEASLVLPSDYKNIEATIEAPRFLYAGLKRGEQIGRVVYTYNGKILASSPLILCEDVPKIKYGIDLFKWFKNLFTRIKEL